MSKPPSQRSSAATRTLTADEPGKLLDAARFGTLGQTGLNQLGGFINEEFLPALKGTKGARVYREMADNETAIGAVVFALTSLLRGATWSVQQADDTPEAERGREFVEEVMGDMAHTWAAMICEACSMFVYGYAPMEITWKRRSGKKAHPFETSKYTDGMIAPAAIQLRAQTTIFKWEIEDASGLILGLWQMPISGPTVYIPMEKLLLFRTTEERNNPEGRSLLRTAYRSWFYKKRLEEIEAIGMERDLAGLPVAKIPLQYFQKDADPADKAIFDMWKEIVSTIRRDKNEGLLIPSTRDPSGNPLFELELLSAGGSRTFDTTKIIDRHSRGMAMSVLADFIFLGQQAVGSFALSSDKTALFSTALGAFKDSMVEVLQRGFIDRLWEYNAFPEETKPTLAVGDLETPNLTEVAAYLTALSGAGMPLFPDPTLENHLRDMAGLPPAPENTEALLNNPLLVGRDPTDQTLLEHGLGQEAADADLERSQIAADADLERGEVSAESDFERQQRLAKEAEA